MLIQGNRVTNGSLSRSNSVSSNEGAGSIVGSITGASPLGRRRSNSNPIKSDATSGAAAALNYSRNGKGTPIKSPLRNQHTSGDSTNDTGDQESLAVPQPRGPSRITKKLLAVEEEEDGKIVHDVTPPNSKLSAAQRFQQHVRNAAKEGTLVTHQRETLTTVTFDPNNASDLHIRRYHDAPKVEENLVPSAATAPATTATPARPVTPVTPSAPSAPLQLPSLEAQISIVQQHLQAVPQRRTRDQVTRQNTKRNSHIPDIPPITQPPPVSASTLAIADNESNSTTTTTATTNSSISSSTINTEQHVHQQADLEQEQGRQKSTTPDVQDDTRRATGNNLEGNENGVGNGGDEEEETTTVIFKKVRFIGVPEYTEAEDAPTKYSHALLRNFAYFRNPHRSSTAKAQKFTKSDQFLQEESLSFRANQQINGDNAEDVVVPQPPPGAGLASKIAPKPKGGLASKFKSKLL